MNVAVISDSHGAKRRLKQIRELCSAYSIDCIIHLGDIVDDAEELRANTSLPLYNVAGNCDYECFCPREQILTLAGHRILLTHGNQYGVKFGYERLSYAAEEKMAKIALFGHTHRGFAAFVGGVLLINPGALKNGDWCLLKISEKDVIPYLKNLD